jgi:hypothetical protein
MELDSSVPVMASDGEPKPLWNPRTGIFDAGRLRAAIVARGWTVPEFVDVAGVSRGCLYGVLLGHGVTDRTAIRILRGLSQRAPLLDL